MRTQETCAARHENPLLQHAHDVCSLPHRAAATITLAGRGSVSILPAQMFMESYTSRHPAEPAKQKKGLLFRRKEAKDFCYHAR
jgi:hypothetical protein